MLPALKTASDKQGGDISAFVYEIDEHTHKFYLSFVDNLFHYFILN